ncbi:MAG: nitronate monooxygenase [Candidatus Helarchaeota archaeon]|nr:nitronate monooxygenase [Candidatus Helarchaeota archaeon]
MVIRTRFQEMIGTKYPIIQAGMGPYSTTELCLYSARAGAVGLISTIGMGVGLSAATPDAASKVFGKGSPDVLISQAIMKVWEGLKDYPDAVYGVNVPVSYEFVAVAKRLMRGIVNTIEEHPEIKKKLKVIVTSAGDPLPWAIDAKAKGAKRPAKYQPKTFHDNIIWCHVVPAVVHAKRSEKADVDIIIASGHEGGAHIAWDPVHSMVLLPAVIKAVNKPVVAAGGYCDGRTLAAAIAMGAIGVQMGTRFIATKESEFQDIWKQAIVDRDERGTLVGRGLFGPMRFLRNAQSIKVVEETLKSIPEVFLGKPMESTSEIMKLELEGMAHLFEGDVENSIILGGEVTGRIDSIPTIKDLVEGIMTEAEEIIKTLPEKVIAKVIKAS